MHNSKKYIYSKSGFSFREKKTVKSLLSKLTKRKPNEIKTGKNADAAGPMGDLVMVSPQEAPTASSFHAEIN